MAVWSVMYCLIATMHVLLDACTVVQVRDMLYDSCAMWLTEYKCDGLRFDSANDLPRDMVQVG